MQEVLILRSKARCGLFVGCIFAGIVLSTDGLEKKEVQVHLSENMDHTSSAASISASGQFGMLHNASPLVRRVRDANASDIDAINKLAAEVVEQDIGANTKGKGTSFRLEFRSVVLTLLLLEASCLFLSNRLALDGNHDQSSQPSLVLQPLALQPIRFLGIVIIVFHHETSFWHKLSPSATFWHFLKHFGAWGDSWVQFFLALSGFVLYLNQNGAPKVPSAATFIWKRFIGMYPAYIFSILLGIAAAEDPSKMFSTYIDGHDLPGFLMIDSWAAPYLYAPNLPAWFLCSLFFCWLCFPRWYRLIRHLESPGRAVFLAWLSTFAVPLVHAARWLRLVWDEEGGGSPPGAFAYWHPLTNWQPFVFGMCLARLATTAQLGKSPLFVRKVSASVALVVLLAICFLEPLPPAMKFDEHRGAIVAAPSPMKMFWHKGPLLLPLFAVMLIFIPAGEDYLLRPSLLQNPWALWLGSVSAELYLFHCPVRLMVCHLVDSPSSLLIFLAQFASAAAFNTLQKKLWDAGSRFCNDYKLGNSLRKLLGDANLDGATSPKT